MRLRLKISPVKPDVYQLPPEYCPNCGGTTWHSHGRPNKAIRDTRLDEVKAQEKQVCLAIDIVSREDTASLQELIGEIAEAVKAESCSAMIWRGALSNNAGLQI